MFIFIRYLFTKKQELKKVNRKKETRGGTRKGSGAKPKYSEQTKTVAFRCPLSKVDELKKIINEKLNEFKL